MCKISAVVYVNGSILMNGNELPNTELIEDESIASALNRIMGEPILNYIELTPIIYPDLLERVFQVFIDNAKNISEFIGQWKKTEDCSIPNELLPSLMDLT